MLANVSTLCKYFHTNFYWFLNVLFAAERQRGSTLFLTLHEVLAFSCPVPGRVIAAERQRGSTLFLTLHEVLAFSCPVPGRVIFSRCLDFCGEDVSKSGGKLSIQVGF